MDSKAFRGALRGILFILQILNGDHGHPRESNPGGRWEGTNPGGKDGARVSKIYPRIPNVVRYKLAPFNIKSGLKITDETVPFTLVGPGEVKVDLADYDLKLQENL